MRFLLLLLWPLLCFCGPLGQAQSEEEALFLRRIADFWQEGEVQLAKSQIEEFLSQFPESDFSNILSVALGDLYMREKSYSQALDFYSRVTSPEFSDRVFLSRMQCLYHMQWYATLADECEAYLAEEKEENKLQGTYFLAIALYQQCLNAVKEPETLLKLARRAEPHFETLFQSELSHEVAQSFAHLCCILKDFSKASQIYLDIAAKDPELKEEMLFQAALIQSEYDKELARQTFGEIAKLGEKRAKEASYNQLILSYDTGHHEELAQEKEAWIREVPPEREGMAHLFLGRSFLSLKKYSEASIEFQAYLQNGTPSATTHAALLGLLDASFQSNNLTALELAIGKLTEFYPQDAELPKALLSRAQLLKKGQETSKAREQLVKLLEAYPQFPQKPQAAFELAHIDFQNKSWGSCRHSAHSFITQFPTHEFSLFAWRYFVTASAELARENPGEREQLIADLQAFLSQKKLLSPEEIQDWQFLLAATYFEMGRYAETLQTIQSLPHPEEANAKLLLALCYRDSLKDLDRFCQMAEEALANHATLVEKAQIHLSLFNAYLERSSEEKAAEHLYAAFMAKGEIQRENLLWLAESYYARMQEAIENDLKPPLSLSRRTASILERFILDPELTFNEETLYLEPAFCKLAKLYAILGRPQEGISLLEKLTAHYLASPELEWNCQKETNVLLAESYKRTGKEEQASFLFDQVLNSSGTIRNKLSARASLEGARLKLAKFAKDKLNPELMRALAQLKDLVLQRSLPNEPIHLEAALDYIDFQTKLDAKSLDKRLSLLVQTKADFEQANDLLSIDYHQARAKLPRKDRIYQGYIHFMDAEILVIQSLQARGGEQQKELQAKAKAILLQIIEDQAHPALVGRARQQLKNAINVNETKT
ncbi:MAG TPA: tetratricopeptide repeat protein [Chlamydiales bacterium]|nr:tetratricopeptide repeat protein [Chlamydiales bacterium]